MSRKWAVLDLGPLGLGFRILLDGEQRAVIHERMVSLLPKGLDTTKSIGILVRPGRQMVRAGDLGSQPAPPHTQNLNLKILKQTCSTQPGTLPILL